MENNENPKVQLGEILRIYRTKKNLTIEEVADSLRVRPGIINDLEDGKNTSLKVAYSRLLIKKYANLVQIPEEGYLSLLDEVFEKNDNIVNDSATVYIKNEKIKKKQNETFKFLGIVVLLIIIVVILLVNIVFSIKGKRDDVDTAAAEEIKTEEPVVEEPVVEEPVVEETESDEVILSNQEITDNVITYQINQNGYSMEIDASGPMYIDVTFTDGNSEYIEELETLAAGEKLNIDVPKNTEVEINVGVLKYFSLKINGQELDLKIPENQDQHSYIKIVPESDDNAQ